MGKRSDTVKTRVEDLAKEMESLENGQLQLLRNPDGTDERVLKQGHRLEDVATQLNTTAMLGIVWLVGLTAAVTYLVLR